MIQSISLEQSVGSIISTLSGDGRILAIGVATAGDASQGSGFVAVYEFENGAFVLRKTLTGSKHFGVALALDQTGDQLLIGAGGVNNGGEYGAKLYVRDGDDWIYSVSFSTAAAGGSSVGMNRAGDRVVVSDWPNHRAGVWTKNETGAWVKVQNITGLGTAGFVFVMMDDSGDSLISFTNAGVGPYQYTWDGTKYVYRKGYGVTSYNSFISQSGDYLLIQRSSGARLANRGSDGLYVEDTTVTYPGRRGMLTPNDRFIVMEWANGDGIDLYRKNDTTDTYEQVVTGVGYGGAPAQVTYARFRADAAGGTLAVLVGRTVRIFQ